MALDDPSGKSSVVKNRVCMNEEVSQWKNRRRSSKKGCRQVERLSFLPESFFRAFSLFQLKIPRGGEIAT